MKFNGVGVQKIELIEEEIDVVNFECSPHSYYIANGLVSHNCDTKYAIKGGKNHKMTVEDIVEHIDILDTHKCQDVTFTGGEPMLHINELCDVMCKLYTHNFHFETNGTIFPDKYLGALSDLSVDFVVSPKLHAINDKYIEALKMWTTLEPAVCFKFVYESPETIKQIAKLKEKIPFLDGISIPIYLMPEGIKFDQAKYEETVEACIKNGYIMSSRLHNIIWGNKRGV